MIGELEILELVSERLEATQIPYMLTGSYALAYYATPRMTRDLDLVVALSEHDIDAVVSIFSPDFYIDADDVLSAVRAERMFNLMHFASGIKVDLIVRKSSEYRHVEFARRERVSFGGIDMWIVSREDLILSKLVWAKDSNSDQQRRDARSLSDGPVDRGYLERWARELDVENLLREVAG